eukprot:jgi/Ulvmu1/2466/UM136_0018.1
MAILHGAEEEVDRLALRNVLKDMMQEVQRRTSFTANDVLVMDNIREAYVRTATPRVVTAAMLGFWPYLPLAVQRTIIPKFMTFPTPKTMSGWLSKSMFCSVQVVMYGSIAAESVAEHAWYNGLKAAVESQTEVGVCFASLLNKHEPDSALLKSVPPSTQPLLRSTPDAQAADLFSASAPEPAAESSDSTEAAAAPGSRRNRNFPGGPGRVPVQLDDVPEYVLLAMITRQIEARLPQEELQALDPKRARRSRPAAAPDGATPAHPPMPDLPRDAWGGVDAAATTPRGTAPMQSEQWDSAAQTAAGGPARGRAVEGGGGDEAADGERKRGRALPPPPTAEELAKREEEAVWGWSEAGAAAGGPAEAAGGAGPGRRHKQAAAAAAGSAPRSATLVDEWNDSFPGDVPRTSDDWEVADVGAEPEGRPRGRTLNADAVAGYVPGGNSHGPHTPRRRRHHSPADMGSFAEDPRLEGLGDAPPALPHRRHHGPAGLVANRWSSAQHSGAEDADAYAGAAGQM